MGPVIDVILPALDEQDALPWVLDRLPVGFRAIVVDNGSTDRTAEVAVAHGATLVAEPQRGFGAACWAGLAAAETEVVCFMDADASFDPRQLPSVAGPVVDGAADLVLGARRDVGGAWPWHARVANRVLAAELRRRTGERLTDLGPMRAARLDALRSLGLRDRRSGWPLEMVLRAHREGWRLLEVTVDYRPRVGSSKVTGTVRGTLRAVSDMSQLLAVDRDRAR